MKFIRVTHVRIGLDVKDAISLARKLGCTIVDGGMGRLISHPKMPAQFNLMMGRREIPIEFVRWLNALLIKRQDEEQVALAMNEGQITPTGQILDDHGKEVDEREKQERAAEAASNRAAEQAAHRRKHERIDKKARRQREADERRAAERLQQEQRAHEHAVTIECDRSRALNLELLHWEALDTLRMRIANEFERRDNS